MPRQAYRRSARSSIPPDFEQFWNAFDYKVGRQPALRAWEKTASVRPPLAELLYAVKLYRGACAIHDRPGAHPSTWLNQQRWTDDLTRELVKVEVHDALPGTVPETPWRQVVRAVRNEMSPWQWHAWIVPLTCVEDTGLALVVTAPDTDHARYVRKYYQAVLEAAAGTVGRMVRLA